MRPGYTISIGANTFSNERGKGDGALTRLVCELGLDGIGGRASFWVGGSGASRAITSGEPVEVKLDGGAGETLVFTGQVEQNQAGQAVCLITALDGLSKLAACRMEGAYQDVTAGFVAKELINGAGAEAGEVEEGPELSSYYLHRGPTALTHLRRLAGLFGADLFTDGAGKVQVALPQTGGPDHTFNYGEHILRLAVEENSPPFDGAEVWGEGAAGSKGADKAHWLAKDLSGVSGQAQAVMGEAAPGSRGERPLFVRCGALRSMNEAQKAATGLAKQMASRSLTGWADLLLAPQVAPGQRVALAKLPPQTWGALGAKAATIGFRVRRVRHSLDVATGYLTRLEF